MRLLKFTRTRKDPAQRKLDAEAKKAGAAWFKQESINQAQMAIRATITRLQEKQKTVIILPLEEQALLAGMQRLLIKEVKKATNESE